MLVTVMAMAMAMVMGKLRRSNYLLVGDGDDGSIKKDERNRC